MATKPNDVDEKKDQGNQDPSDSSPEKQNPQDPSQGGNNPDVGEDDTSRGGEGDPKGESIKVPKSRLDEVLEENKKLRKEMEEESSKRQGMEKKFNDMAKALNGESTKNKTDAEIEQLAKKHRVPVEFVEDFIKLNQERSKKAVSQEITPVKKQAAAQAFQNEMRQLKENIPEANHMTEEEEKELRRKAHSKGYLDIKLEDIYKIVTHGNPTGTQESIEKTAGRRGTPSDDNPREKLSQMDWKEFDEYAAEKAKKYG